MSAVQKAGPILSLLYKGNSRTFNALLSDASTVKIILLSFREIAQNFLNRPTLPISTEQKKTIRKLNIFLKKLSKKKITIKYIKQRRNKIL